MKMEIRTEEALREFLEMATKLMAVALVGVTEALEEDRRKREATK